MRSSADLEKLPHSVISTLLAELYPDLGRSRQLKINKAMNKYAPIPSCCTDVLLLEDNLACIFSTLSPSNYVVAAVCKAWKAAWEAHLVSLKLLICLQSLTISDDSGYSQHASSVHILSDGRVCFADCIKAAEASLRWTMSVVTHDHTHLDWATCFHEAEATSMYMYEDFECRQIESSTTSVYSLHRGGYVKRFRLIDGVVLATTDALIEGPMRQGPLLHAMCLHDDSLYVAGQHSLSILDPDSLVVQRTVAFSASPGQNLRSLCIRNSLLYICDYTEGVQTFDLNGQLVRKSDFFGAHARAQTMCVFVEELAVLCPTQDGGRTVEILSLELDHLRSHKVTHQSGTEDDNEVPFDVCSRGGLLGVLYPGAGIVPNGRKSPPVIELWGFWVPGCNMEYMASRA